MTVSVVVPVLNDAEGLGRLLADLAVAPQLEVVVVDGGSDDGSREVARAADMALSTAPGRGEQMRLGSERASGDWLWFLHADSRVGANTVSAVESCLTHPGWGFCRVRLDGIGWPYRLVETAMNWRSAASGIATGDQGMFVHRRLLDAVGGFPSQPLMEDIECCRRLRRLAKPRLVGHSVGTSARRWQRDGVVRTILAMWWLRLRYWAGADADELAMRYYA